MKIKNITNENRLPYTDGSRAVYQWHCPDCGDKTYATDRENTNPKQIAADPLCCYCRDRKEPAHA